LPSDNDDDDDDGLGLTSDLFWDNGTARDDDAGGDPPVMMTSATTKNVLCSDGIEGGYSAAVIGGPADEFPANFFVFF